MLDIQLMKSNQAMLCDWFNLWKVEITTNWLRLKKIHVKKFYMYENYLLHIVPDTSIGYLFCL